MIDTDGGHWHPAFNALLNVTTLTFLMLGRIAIKRGNTATHRRHMVRAVTVSAVFLVSYVIRFATTGAHKYPGEGWDRTFYLATLLTHSTMAVVLVPLVVVALRRALRGEDKAHKQLVKFVWPMWVYVSATGVVVYAMLYHVAPALHA